MPKLINTFFYYFGWRFKHLVLFFIFVWFEMYPNENAKHPINFHALTYLNIQYHFVSVTISLHMLLRITAFEAHLCCLIYFFIADNFLPLNALSLMGWMILRSTLQLRELWRLLG